MHEPRYWDPGTRSTSRRAILTLLLVGGQVPHASSIANDRLPVPGLQASDCAVVDGAALATAEHTQSVRKRPRAPKSGVIIDPAAVDEVLKELVGGGIGTVEHALEMGLERDRHVRRRAKKLRHCTAEAVVGGRDRTRAHVALLDPRESRTSQGGYLWTDQRREANVARLGQQDGTHADRKIVGARSLFTDVSEVRGETGPGLDLQQQFGQLHSR